MPSRPELSLSIRYLGSLLPVLAVSAGISILLVLQRILGPIDSKIQKFEAQPLSWDTDRLLLGDHYEIVASGIWWLFSTYVFWLAASICSAVCLWVIFRSLDQYGAKIRWVALGIIAIVFLLLGFWLSSFETIVAGGDLLVGVEQVASGSRKLMELTNGYFILTAMLIILSSCIVLLPRLKGSVPDRSFLNLNILLYSGAMLILTWLMYYRIMYSFGGSLLVPDQQRMVDQIAPTIALIAGAISSIYLAMIYLSGLGWLQIQHVHSGIRGTIADSSGEQEERAPSPFNKLLQNWPKILAVLGPALPGIAEIFLGFGKLI